jgi:hypothetical protein
MHTLKGFVFTKCSSFLIFNLATHQFLNVATLLFRRKYGRVASKWFLIIYGSNWFVNYCSSRAMINAMETALTSAAIYFYPSHPATYVSLV